MNANYTQDACMQTAHGECRPILRYAPQSGALRTSGRCIESMSRLILTWVVLQLAWCPNLHAFPLFGPSTPPTPEEIIATLKDRQADTPNDPVINYNLGVACFRNNQLGEAKTNFTRSLEYAGDNNELRTRCLFNCGKTCHTLTTAMLPPNWEQKDQKVEQEILEKAITEIRQAIEHYEKFKKIDPKNTRADKNLEQAKELLKKLEEKWQQQQKKDQRDNKKEQQKQPQDQQQKNQEKNEQNDKKQDSSSDKKQENDGQQKAEKDQRQGDRPNDTQDPRSKPEQGQGDNKEQKKNAKDSQQPDNHQKPPEQKKPEQPEDKGKQQEQEKQQTEQPGQGQPATPGNAGQDKPEESQEMRTIRGMLDNLQDDESKTQAALMREKMKKITPQQQSTQKTW